MKEKSNDNFEKFKNIALGIQSIILSLAVIVGGIWTLYTFNTLNQIESSKNELEQRKRQLNKIPVNFEIKTIQLEKNSLDKKGLIVQVVITNNSEFTVFIELNKNPLAISKIKKNENFLESEKTYYPKFYLEVNKQSKITGFKKGVNPNSIQIVEFYEEIEEKGLYFISFRSKVDRTVMQILDESKIGVSEEEFNRLLSDNIYWRAQKYLEIN